MITDTVRPVTGRRAVRRRPTLDQAWDPALSELAPAVRPLVRQYAENMQQGQEIRSALSTAMTRCGGVRWQDVDRVTQQLWRDS